MAGRVNERSERESSGRSSAFRGPRSAPACCEVWGILNVTPDSFSDGGLHFTKDDAVARALAMLDEGADVIDVGGASSRPRGLTYGAGAAPVGIDEEIRRVVPVIETLLGRAPLAVVSVDTTSAEVAEAAVTAGARIVNDVSMGRSEGLLDVCARHDVELVLMHTRSDGRIDETTTRYDDVVCDVLRELDVALARARERGVAESRLWTDPGLGFAKTASQSMKLLRSTRRLADAGVPVLIGASRKSFLGQHTKDALGRVPPADARIGASVAAVMIAGIAGARAVRVHDVRASRQALQILDRATPAATPTIEREVRP
jgi:dihydropteroate synthase